MQNTFSLYGAFGISLNQIEFKHRSQYSNTMSGSLGDPRTLEDIERQFHDKDGVLKDNSPLTTPSRRTSDGENSTRHHARDVSPC